MCFLFSPKLTASLRMQFWHNLVACSVAAAVLMATMKLYGTWVSTCTRRVLTTLHEKGVSDFALEAVELKTKDHKKPQFLALQPFGQLPVFQDGVLTLFESRAIARYIADKYKSQGTALYGKSAKDRARVEQWMEVESHNYNPPIHDAVVHIAFPEAFGVKSDPAVIKRSIEQLQTVLDIYEGHLGKHEYLAGNFFSLADLSHLPFTEYLIGAAKKGDLITSRKNVSAWWNRISSRPSWKKTRQNGK